MATQKAAKTSEIAPGAGKCVVVEGMEIAIFNVGGRFYAIDNTCPHSAGPLAEGELLGTTVACPWHFWQFEVTTGASKFNPAVKIKTFPVELKGEEVYVTV